MIERKEKLEKLRKYRGALPGNFVFNREEANERSSLNIRIPTKVGIQNISQKDGSRFTSGCQES